MIVKILGALDLLSALTFLMLVFGINPILQLTMFCAGILLLKGMFVFTGDVLSFIDIFASILLILSLFFTLYTSLIWVFAFLLLAKGVVSFL